MVTTLLLAAGLSIPSLIDRLSYNDYPSWAVREGVSGGSIVQVTVDPQGKVVRCNTIGEIGDSRLAKAVCPILSRKRHRPSTLRNGQTVHAFLDTIVNFYLPNTKEGRKIGGMRQSPDAELTVNKLPAGEQSDVSILLALNQAGKVTDCAPAEDTKLLALAKLACDQRAIFDGAIQNDESGQPVVYVTRKTVRFKLSPPAR